MKMSIHRDPGTPRANIRFSLEDGELVGLISRVAEIVSGMAQRGTWIHPAPLVEQNSEFMVSVYEVHKPNCFAERLAEIDKIVDEIQETVERFVSGDLRLAREEIEGEDWASTNDEERTLHFSD